MSLATQSPSASMSAALSSSIASADLGSLIARVLAPRVTAIDLEGEYPEAFLRALGGLGGMGVGVPLAYGGAGLGLMGTLTTMAQVGEVCLSTAFLHWCHTACAHSIAKSDNEQAKTALLPALARGELLGGTGLSNTLKSACEMESFLLSAKRVDGGYEINGTLPWVSNLGEDHIFVTGCPVEGDGRLVFVVVHCNQAGFKLVNGAEFTALEGTRTFACQFRNVRIDDDRVLAHPEQAQAYLPRIQPGLVLAQMGMGLGLVRDCIHLVEAVARTHSHVNCFETDQAAELREALNEVEVETFRLAALLDAAPAPASLPRLITDVMRVRLTGGELSLRAANAAMLHQGARGYLRKATAQRRLREAYFVAILTPALKHLRREIARRESLGL